jgi:hypothetical protein
MAEIFKPAPEPPTALGRYRVLYVNNERLTGMLLINCSSTTAGVRVSPLCLGAMSIGEAWKEFMGHLDKEGAFKLLDAFYDAGGELKCNI